MTHFFGGKNKSLIFRKKSFTRLAKIDYFKISGHCTIERGNWINLGSPRFPTT